MKYIRIFLSENFPFLLVKFSIYLNRHVFVIKVSCTSNWVDFYVQGYTVTKAG